MLNGHIPQCQHVKDDGFRCGSPALRGKKRCYFHERQRKTFPHRRPYRTTQFCRPEDFFNVQTPDDVMVALNQVMNALLRHQLSPKEARAIIIALQTASTFAPHTSATRAQRTQSSSSPSTQPTMLPFLCDHSITRQPDAALPRPKSVADVFEIFPGFDDLKALLSPEDIVTLENP
jgi:hypothetical protein